MATLAENAAAVKAAQVAIDAAIVAKGGTTEGGLNNAAAAIQALPSGGGLGNGLPEGCPRVDLIKSNEDADSIYVVIDSRFQEQTLFFQYCYTTGKDGENVEVLIDNSGNVTETENRIRVDDFNPIILTGKKYHVVRISPANRTKKITGFSTSSQQSAYLINVVAIVNDANIVVSKQDFGLSQDHNYSIVYAKSYKERISLVDLRALHHYDCVGYGTFGQFSTERAYAVDKLILKGILTDGMYAFRQADNLRMLDLSNLDMSSVSNTYLMFQDLPMLSVLLMPKGDKALAVSYSISDLTNLTKDSLLDVIDSLPISSGQVLTIGTTNLDKLADAEKQIATDKGWTLV